MEIKENAFDMDETSRASEARATKSPQRLGTGRLLRVGEIAAIELDLPILHAVTAWIRGYLARPHVDLGRPGVVCPFVPRALHLDQIHLSTIRARDGTPEEIEKIIFAYRDQFLEMEADAGADAGRSGAAAGISAELDEVSARLEERMQRVCEYYFSDDPELGPRLRELSAGSGRRDRALDLLGYADVYEKRYDVVSKDPLHFRPSDVADARRLAEELLEGSDAYSYRAIVAILPDLTPALVESIQSRLKPRFVDVGLMIGEFHPFHDGPALHNPLFRPLRSPFPILAIRRIVETDLVFLNRDAYTAPQRAEFLRSYLRVVGPSLLKAKHDAVRAELEAAEAAAEKA